jgi:hypothetical protein
MIKTLPIETRPTDEGDKIDRRNISCCALSFRYT